MYYRPTEVTVKRRPTNMDEAVAAAEAWTDRNIDYVDQNTKNLHLGIQGGNLALAHRGRSGDGFPITRRAMSTLLRRLHLPTSLANLFDPPKSESYLAEQEAKVEHGLDFMNGLLRDLATPITLRGRDGYVRSVLGPGEMILNYDETVKCVARSFKRLKIESHPKMFKEMHLSDSMMPIAIAPTKVDAQDDKLRAGFKVTFSEDGETSNDVFAYTWRLVCTNGLMVPVMEQGRLISTRALRSDFQGTVTKAISDAYNFSDEVAHASLRLGRFDVVRRKGEERMESYRRVVARLSKPLGIPRGARDMVVAVWAAQQDRSLYGLQNALTTLGRQERGQSRSMYEHMGGRLVCLKDRRLEAVVN